MGQVEPDRIDEINILNATKEAIIQAINNLTTVPDLILIDGKNWKLNNLSIPYESIIKGDSLSASIASASIIAKVTRDKVMEEYDLRFPDYLFSKNKGYPTQEHKKILSQIGPCSIHRKSFSPIKYFK